MSVLVYGRREPACKFCKAATDTLDLREVDYEFIDLSLNPELMELFKMHHETIPQIYYNDGHAGGSEASTHVGVSKNNDPLDWAWVDYEG